MHSLFLVHFINLYMFWAYLGPWSGGTTACIQKLVLIIIFRWLSVVLVGFQDNRQSSKKIMVPIAVYILLYLLMMGLDTPETCRGSRNILRISCASSWFFFTQYWELINRAKNSINVIIRPTDARMWNILSHVIYYRHVSTAVVDIIGVIYEITRSPKKTFKMHKCYNACLKLPI